MEPNANPTPNGQSLVSGQQFNGTNPPLQPAITQPQPSVNPSVATAQYPAGYPGAVAQPISPQPVAQPAQYVQPNPAAIGISAAPAPNGLPPAPSSTAAPGAQPTPQPLYGSNTVGVPDSRMAKLKKQALWLSLISLGVFVVGLFVGVAALGGALLGIYAVRKAKVARYTPALVIGIIGIVLNAAFFLLAIAVNGNK